MYTLQLHVVDCKVCSKFIIVPLLQFKMGTNIVQCLEAFHKFVGSFFFFLQMLILAGTGGRGVLENADID